MLILLLIFFLISSHSIFATNPTIQITDFSSDSSPEEWVQITNTTSENINLEGWYFKDAKDNVKNIDDICISSNSYQIIKYSSGWLNNDGDTIKLYNATETLIDELVYSDSESRNQIAPDNTNSCAIPTPTTDPVVVNPTSGISLSEFMPYSSIEWIEIYNQNDFKVKLVGWQVGDNSSVTKNIPDLIINAKSFGTFDFSTFLNNNDADKVVLYDNNKKIVSSYEYHGGAYSLEMSWSLVNSSWCRADITKGQTNDDSCFTPTPTPTLTSTPTPTFTPTPTLTPTLIPSVTLIPTIEELLETITPTSEPMVLGETTTGSDIKKNYLPLILIIGGGVLLISPLIITKLKKS